VNCIEEKDFVASVEALIAKLAGAEEVDEDLHARSHEVLMEGYGRALALEGERRRVRERQLQLADVAELDAVMSRELAALAQREARLSRRESELRSVLAPLKERERDWQTRRLRR
jgi:hypothetical protein